jgi:putative heme iron utilization protein
MDPETQSPFTAEQVDGMLEHMNDDHADSVLLYVHYYARRPGAEAARMTGIDAWGMDIEATFDGHAEHVRIAFDEPLTDAHDAHMTLVRMSKKARRDLEEA